MAKSVKKDYSKRVIFSPSEQQQFLLRALQNLSLSWTSFADKIGVHRRTLNDWKREEYSMPLDIVKKISKIAKVKTPKNIKVKKPFWYVYKGAKIGGKMGAIACFKKYGSFGGDPEYRKKRWYEWWEREGRFRGLFVRKPINKPPKSPELAEFIGIMLGDGGITPKQICITLHRSDDKEYIGFTSQMIKKLFKTTPSIINHDHPSVLRIIVSRINLIDFLISLGLKKGNKIKQQVNIPNWIKQNKQYAIACVRGLIDTDGCIFTHNYKVNGKWYTYKKLSFRSYSKPLIMSVFKILKGCGLNPRRAQENDLRLDSIADIQRYFRFVGSHNPKHLKRYKG